MSRQALSSAVAGSSSTPVLSRRKSASGSMNLDNYDSRNVAKSKAVPVRAETPEVSDYQTLAEDFICMDEDCCNESG